MDFIEKLREKSAGTKKRIAYATSAVITLIIFGVWVSVLHFGSVQKTEDATAAVANSSDSDVNPFSAFWSVLSSGWGGLMDNINQVKTGAEDAKKVVNALGAAASADVATSSASSDLSAQSLSQKDVFILPNGQTGSSSIMQ